MIPGMLNILMIDDPGCKVCQHCIMGLSLFIVTMNWDHYTQRGEES